MNRNFVASLAAMLPVVSLLLGPRMMEQLFTRKSVPVATGSSGYALR
jgi:hypothetical protein